MNAVGCVRLLIFSVLFVALINETSVKAAPNKILMRFGKRTLLRGPTLEDSINREAMEQLLRHYYLLDGNEEQ
ncbi:hypothetical protein AB6A40_000554 [Gnathostoma spinigerum]|uniref:Uncharacterized protein n=1 Tax=Gnathostoma spinigerum TaxID=75299 RepID=A0ABD6EC31_9BILA